MKISCDSSKFEFSRASFVVFTLRTRNFYLQLNDGVSQFHLYHWSKTIHLTIFVHNFRSKNIVFNTTFKWCKWLMILNLFCFVGYSWRTDIRYETRPTCVCRWSISNFHIRILLSLRMLTITECCNWTVFEDNYSSQMVTARDQKTWKHTLAWSIGQNSPKSGGGMDLTDFSHSCKWKTKSATTLLTLYFK